jgi:hypothetical protein
MKGFMDGSFRAFNGAAPRATEDHSPRRNQKMKEATASISAAALDATPILLCNRH